MEKSICPICHQPLKVIGSRRRSATDENGDAMVLVLRRLRCTGSGCGKIHHELPDLLTPYKRQTTAILEQIITGHHETVPVENSTIRRVRTWFHARAHALVGALLSIYATVTQDYGVDFSDLPQSILERIFFFVGEPAGWLKKVVRILVNNHRWPHTQLA